jgi:hypothetical protein
MTAVIKPNLLEWLGLSVYYRTKMGGTQSTTVLKSFQQFGKTCTPIVKGDRGEVGNGNGTNTAGKDQRDDGFLEFQRIGNLS